ncbi:NADH-quinone oxidoreductase subunit C, partial [Candidatus Margulisiibacteriota bacterium]
KVEIFEKTSERVHVTVDKQDIRDVIGFIFKDLGARFSIASGLDNPGYMEILYHMAFDKHNLFVTVKTFISKAELEIDTITSVVPGAEWIEREMSELLGIKFKGHPDMRRLLLSDEWPEGVYPLRKDYPQMRRD